MTTASEDTPSSPGTPSAAPSCTATAFAAHKIPAGTRIIEYGGQRISAKEADRRHPTNPDDPFHTFFALSSGRVIDGGDEGNDARWINHSCEPNCEAQEGKHGKRVYIVAVRDIARGEELSYDYGLVLDGRITGAARRLPLPLRHAAVSRHHAGAVGQAEEEGAEEAGRGQAGRGAARGQERGRAHEKRAVRSKR